MKVVLVTHDDRRFDLDVPAETSVILIKGPGMTRIFNYMPMGPVEPRFFESTVHIINDPSIYNKIS